MPGSILQSSITVTNLAAGAVQTSAHGLNIDGLDVAPTRVEPDRHTPIVVVSTTATQVTLRNDGVLPASAVFYPQFDHTIQQAADPLISKYWQGIGSGASTTVPTDIVFRPGGVAGGNIFTTWATAYAALSLIDGPRNLHFDDTIVSPCVIPAGGPYDMTDVTWIGGYQVVPTQVSISDGATFTSLITLRRVLVTNNNTAVAACTLQNNDRIALTDAATVDCAVGATAMWDAPLGAGEFIACTLDNFSSIGIYSPNVTVLDMTGANPACLGLFIQAGEYSYVGNNSLAAAAGVNVQATIYTNSASILEQNFVPDLDTSIRTIPMFQMTPARGVAPAIANIGSITRQGVWVRLDASAGSFTQTMPEIVHVGTASEYTDGRCVIISETSGVNPITLDGYFAETIDGTATYELPAGATAMFISDGVSNWTVASWATVFKGERVELDYTGADEAVIIDLNTQLTSQALVVTEDNVARAAHMVSLTRQANATGHVIAIDNDATATSSSINIDHAGSASAVDINLTGGADAINIALATNTTSQAIIVSEDDVARSESMVFMEAQASRTADMVKYWNRATATNVDTVAITQFGGGHALHVWLGQAYTQSALRVTEGGGPYVGARTPPMIDLHAEVYRSGAVIGIENLSPNAPSIDVTSVGNALVIDLDTDTANQAIIITEDAQVRANSMINITSNAARTGVVFNIDNFGSNNAVSVQNYGTAAAFRASLGTDLSNYALYVTEDNLVRTTSMFYAQRQANATGNVWEIQNNATSTSRSINITHASTGVGLYVTHTGAAPGMYVNKTVSGDAIGINNDGSGDSIDIDHGGAGKGINLQLDTGTTGQGIYIADSDALVRTAQLVYIQRNANATGHCVEINNDATATSRSLKIDHEGTGEGIYLDHAGASTGLYILKSTSGAGIVINNSGTGAGIDLRGSKLDLSVAGDLGEYIWSDVDNRIRFVIGGTQRWSMTDTGALVPTVNGYQYSLSNDITYSVRYDGVDSIIFKTANTDRWKLNNVGTLESWGYKLDFSLAGDLGEQIYSPSDNNLIIDSGVNTDMYIAGTKVARFNNLGLGMDDTNIYLNENYRLTLNGGAGNYDTYIYGNNTTLALVADGGAVFSSTSTLITVAAGIKLNDGYSLRFGSSNDSYIKYQTAQTNDAVVWTLSNDSLSLIFCQYGDDGTNFAHAVQANPTIFMQASDATDITKWGSLARGDDDFEIAVGAGGNGDLYLNPDGVVKFGTHTGLAGETVTGYITIKDAAGNSRKLAVVS